MNRIKNFLNKRAFSFEEDAALPWSFSTGCLLAVVIGLICFGMVLAVKAS